MSEVTDATPLRPVPEGAHPLPDGGWVTFRDVTTIRQRDRKALFARIDTARGAGAGDFVSALSAADATLALAVTEWSYDLPLPAVSPDVLDELDIPVYDALAQLAEPFREVLFPSAEPTEDKTSPTGPSVA